MTAHDFEALLRGVPLRPVWNAGATACLFYELDYPAMARAVREAVEKDTLKLREWISDLQSGFYINCVYCGFRYGPGESTPATLPDAGETFAGAALREHVARCTDHPMNQLREQLVSALARVAALCEALGVAKEYFERILHRSKMRGSTLMPKELQIMCEEGLAAVRQGAGMSTTNSVRKCCRCPRVLPDVFYVHDGHIYCIDCRP